MDDHLWQPWRNPCLAWSLSCSYVAQWRREPAFRQLKRSSKDLLGCCGALLSEAQHHSVADFYFSVPRRRRATGKDRASLPQSRAHRPRLGPEHSTIWNHLWHAGDCGFYRRHGAWRLLHFVARTEACHRPTDHYYEPAERGLC